MVLGINFRGCLFTSFSFLKHQSLKVKHLQVIFIMSGSGKCLPFLTHSQQLPRVKTDMVHDFHVKSTPEQKELLSPLTPAWMYPVCTPQFCPCVGHHHRSNADAAKAFRMPWPASGTNHSSSVPYTLSMVSVSHPTEQSGVANAHLLQHFWDW